MKKLLFLIALVWGMALYSGAQDKVLKGLAVGKLRTLIDTTEIKSLDGIGGNVQVLLNGKANTADIVDASWYTPQESDSAAISKSLFSISCDPATYTTPLDNTVYYYGSLYSTGLGTSAGAHQFTIPFNCTLVGFSHVTRSSAACTAETGSLFVRVNNTSDITLSTAITWGVGGGSVVNYFYSNSLSTNLTAGDKIELKLLTPTWATDATSIISTTYLYFKMQ